MSAVAIVGAGYTGLATAIALAMRGHHVVCADVDHAKVALINRGLSPLDEPGFKPGIRRLVKMGRLVATTDTSDATRGSSFIFICVGTPSRPDGSLDTSQVRLASSAVGEALNSRGRQVVVMKSTVVPGTTESTVLPLLESSSGLSRGEFGLCANPEFLREGRALEDSLHPSHIIIGELDRESGRALVRLLSGFHSPKFRTSLRVAEAVKYATNAFLSMKISFANEVANICTRLGIDVDEVLRGTTLDPRISPDHLRPGVGFGGSCFPKDLRALISLAREIEYEPSLLAAVLKMNESQHLEAIRLLENELGSVSGKRIALLGLSFKEGTDDIRESRALAIASELVARGAQVIAYDPRAGDAFARSLPGVDVVRSVHDALRGSDGCIVQAAWPEFSRLKSSSFSVMKTPIVVDGRRTWPRNKLPPGIRYLRIG